MANFESLSKRTSGRRRTSIQEHYVTHYIVSSFMNDNSRRNCSRSVFLVSTSVKRHRDIKKEEFVRNENKL